MCMCRSASTKASACRWSRRWLPRSRYSPTVRALCQKLSVAPACCSPPRIWSSLPRSWEASYTIAESGTRFCAARSGVWPTSRPRSSNHVCSRYWRSWLEERALKIGFIVQRYGTEILGGSEYHCRLIAERLAPRHQVEVLTTCAADYITWKNEYPDGTDRIRGVTVRRFQNARTRDIHAFNRYSEWIFNSAHTREDELEWLRQQGPWCPALLEYLERNHHQYDVLVFFTYLYAPTLLGMAIAPHKSILVPTAHDEPAIRLDIYKELFSLPAGLAYNTEVERRFLTTHFSIRAIEEETIGCGVDLPQAQTYPREQPPDPD